MSVCTGAGRRWQSGMGRAICPVCHRSSKALGVEPQPKLPGPDLVPEHDDGHQRRGGAGFMPTINDVKVTGYAKRFGPTDRNFDDAESHLVDIVSDHDGLKTFHVIEVGPFTYGRTPDHCGVVWVVDDTTLDELREAGEEVVVNNSKGLEPEEAADVVLTIDAEQLAELVAGRSLLLRKESDIAHPDAMGIVTVYLQVRS